MNTLFAARSFSRLAGCVLALLAVTTLPAESEKVTGKAPAWDAAGLGPLPWQGISALQVSPDGSRIVVGTMAPPEDPNLIVLDGKGAVDSHYAIGQRWIEMVSPQPNATAMALCTSTDGGAYDFPTVFLRGGQTAAYPPLGGLDEFVFGAFHYGDHSNHLGLRILPCTDGTWVTMGRAASWYANGTVQPASTVNLPVTVENFVNTTAAALPGGTLVVGYGMPVEEGKPVPANVYALQPGKPQPLWSRPGLTDLPAVPPREKGLYGAPLRANGKKEELKQWDVPMTGPLSIAVHGGADGALDRVATADYRGWQRWVISSATDEAQNLGTRFMPAKPVISIHDGAGALVKRFEAEKFAEEAWLDLKFLPDGKQLVAWPHRWTSRGLGGVGFLPADAEARHIYLLDGESGAVKALKMPQAVADLAVAPSGDILVACWDGNLYRFAAAQFGTLPKPVNLGGGALLSVADDGRVIAGRADGVIIALGPDLKELWRSDLNALLPHTQKKWLEGQKDEAIVPGVWGSPGGRLPSDLGGQTVIATKDGYALIEGHWGLSIEREWVAMQAAGLDPMKVKYIMVTHEHGDHAPGAYLWHVITGAQLVSSEETAYTLQHHIPLNSGYGFAPPVPGGIKVKEDTELDLDGLKVKAIRAPGHTNSSMAWSFQKDGKTFVAIGDLIMPRGLLGYAGSPNFSGYDVLATMKKLKALNPDLILPGHGDVAPPQIYLDDGIEVGEKVGWGVIPPSNPDPRFRLTQENVIVAAWNQGAQSAAFGDFNGDGKPDIAIVALDETRKNSVISLFYNRGGKFDAKPDKTIPVPGITGNNLKLMTAHLNGDKTPDFVVAGSNTMLLLSKDSEYEAIPVPISETVHVWPGEDPSQAPAGIRMAARFGVVQELIVDANGRVGTKAAEPEMKGMYLDYRHMDMNGDGKLDFISAYGLLALKDGATINLLQPGLPWRFFGVGDFNGDKKPDLYLSGWETDAPGEEFLNTGDKDRPFAEKPNQTIPWPKDPRNFIGALLRETIATGDWNGDGYDDLFLAKGQDTEIHVLPGSPSGLDPENRQVLTLDYHLHPETGLYVADFNGDGRPDIAALGYTETGVGAGGPLSVYIWCQE